MNAIRGVHRGDAVRGDTGLSPLRPLTPTSTLKQPHHKLYTLPRAQSLTIIISSFSETGSIIHSENTPENVSTKLIN